MSGKAREPVKHSIVNTAAKSNKRATAKPSVARLNNLKTNAQGGREPARQSPR